METQVDPEVHAEAGQPESPEIAQTSQVRAAAGSSPAVRGPLVTC